MQKYFEVVAKCGHVGRNLYYEGHFFVSSNSASTAAQYVKTFPRVKKNHDDAILFVNIISRAEYELGIEQNKLNPYFKCGSKHEQREIWDLIQDGLRHETEHQKRYRDIHDYNKDNRNYKKNKNGIRNPYKYSKYNPKYNYDYMEA